MGVAIEEIVGEKEGQKSLAELHSSVPIPRSGFWSTWRAYTGPALLVSVGYMDPGNWSTDLQAGATYRFGLLWVIGVASVMAMILQVCATRLGIVAGRDLAQACRDHYPSWMRLPNWFTCEIAIAACDLAEVLGSAVALHLLFGIPLFWAVVITACDVLILLALQGYGVRLIEAVVLVLVATIGLCFFLELFVLPQTRPDFAEMGLALVTPTLARPGMVTMAIMMIGATVMPHNLYLHSALVQTREIRSDERSIRTALRFNLLDSVVALTLAFLINAAILTLAAIVFHGLQETKLQDGSVVSFRPDDNPDWIQVAYLTLAPLLGTALASVLFAVALLASGQSSTITGTMAGQVVMEGFLHWRLAPWKRRLITRLVAILPAVLFLGLRRQSGLSGVTDLINLSQLVLGLQLPLAMLPLLHLTSSRRVMGKYANGWFLLLAGWGSCLLIIALDLWGLPGSFQQTIAVLGGE